ncbi:MAG TPA: Ig-like domain-containing protein, partial [Steroidobacteraceae bacterium]
ITSIKVTPSQVTLAPGAFVQFSVTDSQGITIPPLRIVWTSANPSIAAVDAPGVVRYVNPGSVWILASFGMLHDSVLISAPEALPLTQITAGAGQTCGLTPRHVAYCWGYVESGVLGVGFLPPGDYFTPTPMKVLGGIEWASITAGYAQSCGVTTGGDAYCWGTGAPTGIDFSETFYTPARVPGTRTMSALQAGGSTTCGIASNGHAGCWGNYANLAIIPTAADTGGGFAWRGSEPPSFSMMAAGLGYSCGVSVDGVGHCWGLSNGGQLGTGSFAPTLGYVSGYLSVIGSDTVAGGLRFTAIAAGESHTCGITTAGLAYCWGLGDQGQVGVGPMMLSHRYPTPVPVAGGLRFTALSVGLRYSCAITAAGSAYCWGANDRGQLGTGDANPRWTPAAVSGGLRFRSISAGRDHTCGMSDTGVAYCWGDNSEGELGDGMTTEVMHPTPIKVAGQP